MKRALATLVPLFLCGSLASLGALGCAAAPGDLSPGEGDDLASPDQGDEHIGVATAALSDVPDLRVQADVSQWTGNLLRVVAQGTYKDHTHVLQTKARLQRLLKSGWTTLRDSDVVTCDDYQTCDAYVENECGPRGSKRTFRAVAYSRVLWLGGWSDWERDIGPNTTYTCL